MMDEDGTANAALIAAYRLSVGSTSGIPGDIPSLIACAFREHVGEEIPRTATNLTLFRRIFGNKTMKPGNTSANQPESLLATLSKLPPLQPSAQALLDRACSILTSGPPMSMNAELADGEELPAALHTLNQGAVWACLVGGGANPDLEDRVLKNAREEEPDWNEMQNKIRKALTPEAKCLWFLCRKFFFTWNVADKDGESYQLTLYDRCYHHRMYMGRLFMLDTYYHSTLSRARMPRALEVYISKFTHIARTPKGLWGWGASTYSQLGFVSSGFVDPTRLTFSACPKVAELEASLPPWEKHRMVTGLSLLHDRAFILTTAAAVVPEVARVYLSEISKTDTASTPSPRPQALSQITSCTRGQQSFSSWAIGNLLPAIMVTVSWGSGTRIQ
ncbi:hypothetical protein J8273_4254 [Carpediemonas membranifera]|uniref:Uncharacterized protein n=1 Tax=Carpediemonas membranifera TaxID=201153 RepID=A0A8J6BBW0_9EUKA|nr:hypothetical protein J8273_4254 [Carpediemonas membranifera]|eukprot:KAG9394152.1 hypothetical protein J8273_4254 [Carpediemonas membranifera]